MKTKYFFIFGFFIPLLAFWGGCGNSLHRKTEFLMGTFVEVRSLDPRASQIVFEEFRKLDKIFNAFNRDSELSRLNTNSSAVVSEPLFAVLKQSLAFTQASAGAFDVSVGPVGRIWKKSIVQKTMPNPLEWEEARSLTGADNIYLDEATREVRLLKAGMMLDLGGIAKGFALDCAVQKLRKAGVTSALINAGGNVYGLGTNRGKPWRVGIQDPFHVNKVLKDIELTDMSVSTSGDYQQYFELNGKKFSHIIDPRTGYPAESGVVSATLASKDAAAADALSTACVVLGLEKSRLLLAQYPEIQAYVITKDGVLHLLQEL